MGGKSSKLALRPASNNNCRNDSEESQLVYDQNANVSIYLQ